MKLIPRLTTTSYVFLILIRFVTLSYMILSPLTRHMSQFHPNTAPFLAIRFAQRFGHSNPSPRYVDAVATAFRNGYYLDASTGVEFGSRDYGDMSAFIAALLLDREARSIVLDADPSHGSALEPFLKILRVMRSLEFVPSPQDMFVLFGVNLQEAVGQQPYEMPSVFSFFLPEHRPAGKFRLHPLSPLSVFFVRSHSCFP